MTYNVTAMTPYRSLQAAEKEKDSAGAIRDFALACKFIALGKQDGIGGGIRMAQQARIRPSVVEFMKAAVDAGSTTGNTWGGQLADPTGMSSSFVASLRYFSVYDRAAEFMPQALFGQKFAVVTSGATGATINEMMVKPISKLSLSATALDDQQKSLAIAVADEELVRFADVGLFQSELQKAVAQEVDSAFLTKITSGIFPTSSNGGSGYSVMFDIDAALDTLELH
jgi:hypothetical protein